MEGDLRQLPAPVSTQSSDSGVSGDGKEDFCEPCSISDNNSKKCVCAGCLSMYCHSCVDIQNQALKDVEKLLQRLEAAEALYPSSKAFAAQHPLYKCSLFVGRVKVSIYENKEVKSDTPQYFPIYYNGRGNVLPLC